MPTGRFERIALAQLLVGGCAVVFGLIEHAQAQPGLRLQHGKIRCLNCDALFPAGEGRVAFKYFLVRRPSGRSRRK
jgi:hypothetical protein